MCAVVGFSVDAFIDISIHFTDFVKDGADFSVQLEEVVKEEDIISCGSNALKLDNISSITNSDSNNSGCLGVDESGVDKNSSRILGDAVGKDNNCSWYWVVSSPSIVWLEMVAVCNMQCCSSHGTTSIVWCVINSLHD